MPLLKTEAVAVPADKWLCTLHVADGVCCALQAVMLDSTDVNLWYKIGRVAIKLIRLPLARHAFEEGLRCNPDHWPCLDNLITILYTLSDYTSKSRAPKLFSRCVVLPISVVSCSDVVIQQEVWLL